MALDLGTRRIGVAVSDPSGTLATPYEVVERTGDRQRDHRLLLGLVEEAGAERVVVGMPLSLDGGRGPAAVAAAEEIEELAAAWPVPVEAHDERLTTVTAERLLRERGVPARAQRQVVDKVAAAVLLQSWLDARAAGSGEDARAAGSGEDARAAGSGEDARAAGSGGGARAAGSGKAP